MSASKIGTLVRKLSARGAKIVIQAGNDLHGVHTGAIQASFAEQKLNALQWHEGDALLFKANTSTVNPLINDGTAIGSGHENVDLTTKYKNEDGGFSFNGVGINTSHTIGFSKETACEYESPDPFKNPNALINKSQKKPTQQAASDSRYGVSANPGKIAEKAQQAKLDIELAMARIKTLKERGVKVDGNSSPSEIGDKWRKHSQEIKDAAKAKGSLRSPLG